MGLKKSLRKYGTIGTLSLASLFGGANEAEAQFRGGSVEYVQPRENDEALGRILGFYELPGNINGFSFMEFYKNGEGYFGKTYLDRSVVGSIGPRIELNHVDEPFTRAGVGVSGTLPGMPEGGFVRGGILPFWIDKEGKIIKNKSMAQYSFGFDLPHNFRIGGFGDWNLSDEDGVQWGYGELEFTRSFGPVKIGLNPVLYNDGDSTPDIENRLIVGVNF